VEVAVARFDLDTGKLIDARCALVGRTQGLHGAEDIHGIPGELPTCFGTSYGNACEIVNRYAIGSLAIVAHNAAFDRAWFPTFETPWIDSMDFEYPRPVTSRSLVSIALAHGVGVTAAHRALDDVLTLARVLERCREMGSDLETMVKRAMRPKVTVQALVAYDDREKAKEAGFRWEPEKKRWVRTMFQDQIETLTFKTKECA
jgi:DNA polymerase-3 subunit epsilon